MKVSLVLQASESLSTTVVSQQAFCTLERLLQFAVLLYTLGGGKTSWIEELQALLDKSK